MLLFDQLTTIKQPFCQVQLQSSVFQGTKRRMKIDLTNMGAHSNHSYSSSLTEFLLIIYGYKGYWVLFLKNCSKYSTQINSGYSYIMQSRSYHIRAHFTDEETEEQRLNFLQNHMLISARHVIQIQRTCAIYSVEFACFCLFIVQMVEYASGVTKTQNPQELKDCWVYWVTRITCKLGKSFP